MAEPSSFRVNGIWAGGDVAGSITLTNTAATFGWTDIYGRRNAAGQLGLNLDSTHGVVLDVNTDGRAQFFDRAGADNASVRASLFRASGEVQVGSNLSFTGNGTNLTEASNGVIYLRNAAQSAGFQLSGATDAVAHFLTRAGADTATVRAANLRFGTHSAIGAETVSGFISITDAAGNARKLAVVS